MALDLLKRIESRKGLFTVEKITLIHNLLTLILILFIFQRTDHPLHMLWDKAVTTAMISLLMYPYRLAPCKFSAFVHIVIQMSLLSYWYPDTFKFNRILPSLDHLSATAEQWMFGGRPTIWLCHASPQMWMSEPFSVGYFAYYPMILVVTLFYFIHWFDLFEETSFVLATCFLVYYLIYVFIPVAGPQFYFLATGMGSVSQGVFPAIGGCLNHNQELFSGPDYQHRFFYSPIEGLQQAGRRPATAFPSSYVDASTILMIMAWRSSKKLFACLLSLYLLFCGATVYIQAHYLIGTIISSIPAFMLYVLVTKMFKKWLAVSIFK